MTRIHTYCGLSSERNGIRKERKKKNKKKINLLIYRSPSSDQKHSKIMHEIVKSKS